MAEKTNDEVLYFNKDEYDYLVHCARYGRKPDPEKVPDLKVKNLTSEQIKVTLENNSKNVAQSISILTHGNVKSPSEIINNHRKANFDKNVLPLKGAKVVESVAAAKATILQAGKTLGRID